MARFQIPSEQIGSIPRNPCLISAYRDYKQGKISYAVLNEIAERETQQVIKELEAIGCQVVSDGEQRKFDGFAHYCLHDSPCYSDQACSLILTMVTLGSLRHTLKYRHFAINIRRMNFSLSHSNMQLCPSNKPLFLLQC